MPHVRQSSNPELSPVKLDRIPKIIHTQPHSSWADHTMHYHVWTQSLEQISFAIVHASNVSELRAVADMHKLITSPFGLVVFALPVGYKPHDGSGKLWISTVDGPQQACFIPVACPKQRFIKPKHRPLKSCVVCDCLSAVYATRME